MTSQAQTMAFDLTALIAPARPEDFFLEHWHRANPCTVPEATDAIMTPFSRMEI